MCFTADSVSLRNARLWRKPVFWTGNIEQDFRKRSIECVGTIKVSLRNFLSLPQPKVFGVHRKRQSEKSVLYRKRCSTLFVNMMQYEIGRCMPHKLFIKTPPLIRLCIQGQLHGNRRPFFRAFLYTDIAAVQCCNFPHQR